MPGSPENKTASWIAPAVTRHARFASLRRFALFRGNLCTASRAATASVSKHPEWKGSAPRADVDVRAAIFERSPALVAIIFSSHTEGPFFSLSARSVFDGCDPNRAQLTANEFREQETTALGSTPVRKLDLCNNRWWWYQIPTTLQRTRPTTARVEEADGVTRTRTTAASETVTGAVVLLFDSIWTRQANRYPTSDLMVVNGADNLPTNWDNVCRG